MEEAGAVAEAESAEPAADQGEWSTARVIQVAAGQHHSAVLTEDGALYVMGESALNNQQGIPVPQASTPQRLPCPYKVTPSRHRHSSQRLTSTLLAPG